MAEAVLNIVLGKLADVIAKESQLLGGVGKKVEWVQRELTRIKCCLQDADSKCKEDARVQNWLNELRDVAYRIEDATDAFFLKVEDHHQKNPRGVQQAPGGAENSKSCSRFLQKLKKLFKKPLEVPILHKLSNELNDIQNLLEEISKSRVTYGIRDLPVEDKSKGEAVKMPLRRATYSEVDETEVVGLQHDKNNILELLRPEKTSRRAVITIVGAGGLGKTTLACMVYRSAKADFDYHIMLSISQQFSLTDLLRKMISKTDIPVPKDRDVDYYAGELNSFLCNRRYLIILDDVWSGDLWNEMNDLLPDVKNGSRVLITTRLIEVAKSADSKRAPYELNLLDERESLDLLLKKALPYQEPVEKCPVDLLHLADKLSMKCKGLPLALVVLGGILSNKEPSYPVWERVLQTIKWGSDGRDCMRIVAMSYEDMPYYLKACFQYLASFPEDYVISAKRLIRMWVAEGFIPLEGRPTIEIMAEECLEELSRRSMVQVLNRSMNGLIKRFQVHDILRDLAMTEAGHDNFVMVFSQASDDKKPNRIIRRASLQAQEKNSQLMKYVGPNTRSLLLFAPENSKLSLHCSNFRLLTVLEIVDMNDEFELNSLDELIHLKYLGLIGGIIDLSSVSFHRMKSLETVDVRGCRGYPSPGDDFWKVGTLVHVLNDKYDPFFDSPLPEAIDLSNLQILKWVTFEEICDVKLPNLRKLGIKYEFEEWDSITNLLQTLPFLISLGIFGIDLPIDIVYPKALPNYQNLQSLHLHGAWPDDINVEASLFPAHLVKLTLKYSNLNHNLMTELGKLNSLKKLCLNDVFAGNSPLICAEGFPALKYLIVNDAYITELMVTQGVMPKLTNLKANPEINVHLPSGLQHVAVEKLKYYC